MRRAYLSNTRNSEVLESIMVETKTALVVLLATLISVGYAKAPQKIIKGKMAAIEEFPYQVSIQDLKGLAFCGGTIIDDLHILTAAHCIVEPNLKYSDGNIIVITGTADKENRTVNNVFGVVEKIYHPGYNNADNAKNDIAILKLHKRIKFNRYQKSAILPTKDTPAGTEVISTGWGAMAFSSATWRGGIFPRYLQKLERTVISQQVCQKAFQKNKIHPEQICALTFGGGDVCTGDSGGPLSSNRIVVGVASRVNGCDQGYPSMYTRVYSYLPWIRKITKSSSSNVWGTR